MKRFLLQIALALGIVLVAAIAPSPAYAQHADQDSAPTAPRKPDGAGIPPQHANEAQIPASGATTTETTKSFSGVVVKENGEIVLKDPVTKVIYKLDDVAKAKQYMGRRVKVAGKLDMDSNRIVVERIEPVS
jgi:predicted RNA-binding protein